MKNNKFLLLAASVFVFCSSHAQLKFFVNNPLKPVGNPLRTNIQTVVNDYLHQFSSIKGDVIEQNPQRTEYASLLKPDGAETSSITQYSAHNKTVYSWQTLMLSTESFEEAAKKYKVLFNQIKGTNVSFSAGRNYFLQGAYKEPEESKRFTNSLFNFATREEPINKIKVEVNMQFEFPEWKVAILVYEREREDDERGDKFDN